MDCLNSGMISGIVKNALDNSGLSDAALKKVQNQLDQNKSVTGKVHAVITNAKTRKMMVGGNPSYAWFEFPPNANNFESELIRAQENERTVTVNYTDNNNVSLIIDIWLYSKVAYPDR